MINKRELLRIFFASECLFFAFMYIAGSQGVLVWKALKDQITLEERGCMLLKYKIKKLEQERDRFIQEPLYKERIAREQLQMARKGDIVVYYDIKPSLE